MKYIVVVGIIMLLAAWTAGAQDNPAAPAEAASLAQNVIIEDTLSPPDFVPVDAEPVVVSRKNPAYPQLALRSGLEGTVWVKIWVDKEGQPKEAQVFKSDNHVFDSSAIDAARGWVFKPAMKDGKPIAVWVSIPFKYKLEKAPANMKGAADELKKKIDRPTVSIVRGPKNLAKLIKYPKLASEAGIEGPVFASVTLSDSLTISDLKLTKGLEKSCDRAVLAGISAYDFSADKEFAAKKQSGAFSIVVQFVLPEKK